MSEGNEANRVGALDLLRALAVVAVLLYHADTALTGGLLGVSVFFTLSGFLIGSQLWREQARTGTLDLARFWSRRVRRLLPASLLTVAAIVVAWPLFGYRLSGAEVLSSLAPVRNWVLLDEHAAYGASPSPTTHFWSLAIEEQVYLALPLVLLALGRLRRPRVGGAIVAVLALASLGWGAALAAGGRIDRAYFGTDARLGEVLAGVALAIWLAARPLRRWSVTGGSVVGGASLIGLGVLFLTVEWPSAAVSTFAIPATVVLTVLACAAATLPGSVLDRLGRRRPTRLVADHAYELYLVHVPAFALISEYRTGLSGAGLLTVRLAATVLLAGALHQIVEPIRHRRLLSTPTGFGWVAASMVVITAGVVLLRPPETSSSLTTAAASDLPPTAAPGPVRSEVAPSTTVAVDTAAQSDAPIRSTGTIGPPVEQIAGPLTDLPGRPPLTEPTVADPAAATTTTQPAADTVWLLGDSTLRELDDPTMTAPDLHGRLTEAGWNVVALIGIRAQATCGERPFDNADDDLPPFVLAPAREVIAEWYALTPAQTVVIQLGSNDLTQFRFTDDELRDCLTATVEALPSTTAIHWVLPSFGPWCWCAVDQAHADSARFAGVLDEIAAGHPNLSLVADVLAGSDIDQRATRTEDGIHGTEAGRALRVASLVGALGTP